MVQLKTLLCKWKTVILISFFTAMLCLVAFYIVYKADYESIGPERIYSALVQNVTANSTLIWNVRQLKRCSYKELIAANEYVFSTLNKGEVTRTQAQTQTLADEIAPGGEYCPRICQPRFSTAIIVPYRQRAQQLKVFANYMHNYLRAQLLHYRIIVVEQRDALPFNRATLLNIGAKIAAAYGFPCLVLHDVDLLPTTRGQLYACTQQPRHMSTAQSNWKYALPYSTFFGGVVAISSTQFQQINGMSNVYFGWGAEDDDLYLRLQAHGLRICRFVPSYGKYVMMQHEAAQPSKSRFLLLQDATARMQTDGLNSLEYVEKARFERHLYTHVLVETNSTAHTGI